jgi:hypothetical protein
MVDTSRFWVVFALASLVLIAAAVGLLLAVFEWRGRRPKARPGWRKARWAAWLGAMFILSSVLYGRFGEPFWPEVTAVRIACRTFPPQARPIRLAFLADTHCDPEPRMETRLPGLVANLRPDLILFAGDAVNAPGGLAIFQELMRRLVRIAPVYAVKGNWETWWFPHLDLYRDTGVTLLDGRPLKIRLGQGEVWLAGTGIGGAAPMLSGGGEERKGLVRIFLHNFPESAAKALGKGWDLGLAGDTHGGQLRLPFLGPLLRIVREGHYFDQGLHDLPGGHLYVHRGIGMEGGRIPRVRFRCRPEVALIEIGPGG